MHELHEPALRYKRSCKLPWKARQLPSLPVGILLTARDYSVLKELRVLHSCQDNRRSCLHVLKHWTSSEKLEHGKRGAITLTSYRHAWAMAASVGSLSGKNTKRLLPGQSMGPAVNHPTDV